MEERNNELEKVELLTEYKDVIVNNFEAVGYAVCNILCSDEALKDCETYKEILNLDKESCAKSYYDERYILYTLLSMINKLPYSYQEREEKSAKIKCYSRYFENTKRAS